MAKDENIMQFSGDNSVVQNMDYNCYNYDFPSTNNIISNEYLNDQINPTDLNIENKAKFAAVIESDIGSEFEIANGLKNYATVNTAEPVATQLSYNIGTENVENAKEDETLNDTQMQLEGNSIITEIENAGINLYDINLNDSNFGDVFNATNDGPKVDNPKVKIISVQDITPKSDFVKEVPSKSELGNDLINLGKQIYTPEAVQMSLAQDEEIPTDWIDAMNYANSQVDRPIIYKIVIGFYFIILNLCYLQVNIFQESVNENPLTAVPTAIQTYINLPPLQSNPVPSGTNINPLDFNTTNQFYDNQKTPNTDTNLLKNLTAQADICTCVDCKCDSINNCQNCDGPEIKSPKETGCCGSNKTVGICCKPNTSGVGCCKGNSTTPSSRVGFKTIDHSQPEKDTEKKVGCCSSRAMDVMSAITSLTGNKEKHDECCIVVCLKTVDQLRQILSMAGSCSGIQSVTSGCLKNGSQGA